MLFLFKTRIEELTDKMYQELKSTPLEERYYEEFNILNCGNDLNEFLNRIEQVLKYNDNSKEVNEVFYWIFDRLATFDEGDENWDAEYLKGFIFNGYTKVLTDFILDVAFAFGWKKNLAMKKALDYYEISYKVCDDYSEVVKKYGVNELSNIILGRTEPPIEFVECGLTGGFTIVLGSEGEYIQLIYNKVDSVFEYNVNPYGDSYCLPLHNVEIADDFSSLSFDILCGSYDVYNFIAQYESDKAIFRLFKDLISKGVPKNKVKANHCDFSLTMVKGMLYNFESTAYDELHQSVQFDQGLSVSLGVKGFDSKGNMCWDSVESLLPVSEKFLLFNNEESYSSNEIEKIELNKQQLKVITVNNGEYNYPILTTDLIFEMLLEIFLTRREFVSQYS